MQSALISGIPGTGKSWFARFCADQHGFIHVDAEHGGLEAAGLHLAWSAVVRSPPTTVAPLVDAIGALKRPVILDWGYPPAYLPFVRALHDAGIVAWSFDGDPVAARRSFTTRGTVSNGAFEVQMSAIQAAWQELSAFYGSRVVTAIKPDCSFTDPKEIFELIFDER